MLVTKVLSALVFPAQIELPVEVRALLRPHHAIAPDPATAATTVSHVELAYSFKTGVDKLTTAIVGACEDAVAAQPECTFLAKLRAALDLYDTAVREEKEEGKQGALENGRHAAHQLVKVCHLLRNFQSNLLLNHKMAPRDKAAVAHLSRDIMSRLQGHVSVSVGGERPSNSINFGQLVE